MFLDCNICLKIEEYTFRVNKSFIFAPLLSVSLLLKEFTSILDRVGCPGKRDKITSLKKWLKNMDVLPDILTLLQSEGPKLHEVLALLSALGFTD